MTARALLLALAAACASCQSQSTPQRELPETGSLAADGPQPVGYQAPLQHATASPGVHERRIADQQRQIADLQARLDDRDRQLVEARQAVRRQALRDKPAVDEMFALFPAPFPQGDWQPAEHAFEDCWFESSDRLRLHGWYLPHPQARAAVLLVHGNAGNLSHRGPLAQYLHDRFRVTVFVFDYRGYGRSEGSPTISGLLRDARAARDELARRAGVKPTNVVLMGHSLGGAIAVDLAAKDGARGLIVEGTFASLREVARFHYPGWLVSVTLPDRLNSAAIIGQYHGPLLACHGDRDQTVPLEQGQKLFAAAGEPKRFITLRGQGHDHRIDAEYEQALEAFFAGL